MRVVVCFVLVCFFFSLLFFFILRLLKVRHNRYVRDVESCIYNIYIYVCFNHTSSQHKHNPSDLKGDPPRV